MKKIEAQNLKGFRDFGASEAGARALIFQKIRSVFERYGFLPMETPALEYKEILSGKYGAEGEKLMYSFTDRGGREVAMRYDLTVPLARYYAQNENDLAVPFKRYQIAPVWRADRPQKGRFREFTQCDIDVVGTNSLFADAEIIACMNAALKELGVPEVLIKINNRKLLDAIMREAGVRPNQTGEAIRTLDKLEKVGEVVVRGELASLGVQTKQADALFEILAKDFQDAEDFVSKFRGFDGAGELAEVLEILQDMGVKNYQADLTLARGLDYYTGSIFEFVLPDAREFGSVAGGGRYDNLLGMFMGKLVPAVGCSIGVDRLLEALEELELVKYDLVSDVLVCNLDEKFTEKYLKIVQELRGAGIQTDFYYDAAKLDKQLKYADKKNINFAVILGDEEMKKDEATVKNMATGKQERVKQGELTRFLNKS